MPQKVCERGINHVMAYAFFSKCPKIEDDHFRFIFCFQNQMGKVGHFEKKKHVINKKTGNGSKMNIFDFGAFRKEMHIPSHDKFLFHMLFGAFHVTPRSNSRSKTFRHK